MKPEPITMDVDLDPAAPKRARPGYFVVAPSGNISFHPADRAGRVIGHSVLISAGGRTFVSEEGGRRSKAAMGFALLEVGVNCTDEEMRIMREWQAASDRGESPDALPRNKLPKVCAEKRAAWLKKNPRQAAKHQKAVAAMSAPAK